MSLRAHHAADRSVPADLYALGVTNFAYDARFVTRTNLYVLEHTLRPGSSIPSLRAKR